MKKKGFCLLLFSGLLFLCSGQSLISSGDILAAARQDLALDLHRQQMVYIRQNTRTLPFVDQINVRTETDRFDFDRQEYLARVSVNGLNEMRKKRLLQDAGYSAKEVMQKVYLHEALVERYEAVADYRHILRKLGIQQELRLIYEDKLRVLQNMAALNAGAEVDDLLKTEFDLDELVLSISESEALLDQSKQWIQMTTPEAISNWQLDTSGFITVPQIEMIVAEMPDSVSQHPQIAEKQAKIDQISAAYNFEKAQSTQMLDFFQVRYGNLPLVPLNRELSLGFAVNLPIRGSDRVNMSELTIDKSAAGYNMQLYLAELNRQLARSRLQIEALGRRFRLAHQQWQDSQARFTLEHPGNPRTEGPMILLHAREQQLDRQLTLLDIEHQIIDQYINVLDCTGRLSAEPQVNYLSQEFSTY